MAEKKKGVLAEGGAIETDEQVDALLAKAKEELAVRLGSDKFLAKMVALTERATSTEEREAAMREAIDQVYQEVIYGPVQ